LESGEQLVRKILGGDRQAYRPLVQRCQHAVFAAAMKVLDDRDAASPSAIANLRDPINQLPVQYEATPPGFRLSSGVIDQDGPVILNVGSEQ
jgi:hypothetical protein